MTLAFVSYVQLGIMFIPSQRLDISLSLTTSAIDYYREIIVIAYYRQIYYIGDKLSGAQCAKYVSKCIVGLHITI